MYLGLFLTMCVGCTGVCSAFLHLNYMGIELWYVTLNSNVLHSLVYLCGGVCCADCELSFYAFAYVHACV